MGSPCPGREHPWGRASPRNPGHGAASLGQSRSLGPWHGAASLGQGWSLGPRHTAASPGQGWHSGLQPGTGCLALVGSLLPLRSPKLPPEQPHPSSFPFLLEIKPAFNKANPPLLPAALHAVARQRPGPATDPRAARKPGTAPACPELPAPRSACSCPLPAFASPSHGKEPFS